ncbi:transposase, partial [Xanthomonas citri]|uniref:transposase n=1 Tax=Xanthomonas citri TaxID=346 RepID=UPI003CCFAA91
HQEMDAADPRLEGCAEPLYDPVRGATSSAVTQTTVTQNSAHARAERWEHFKASVRAKVEHPFRVIKHQFGYTKVRYRGLAKNTAQVLTLFALSNLWMKRKQLLSAAGSVRL